MSVPPRRTRPTAYVIAAVFSGGCAHQTDDRVDATRGLRAAERQLGPAAAPDERAAAAIDGETLRRDDLWPRLAEAAGGEVLDEFTLERRLEAACAGRSITISDADLENERALLVRSLTPAGAADSGANPGESTDQLVQRIRVQRGLGPVRFASLVRRNAMLRALVKDQVVVSPEAVERAYRLRYGPMYRARVITRISAHDAAEALDRLNNGEDFSRLAAELSTDPSAARGGVLSPINADDPTYPRLLRDTLVKLHPGQTSAPIALAGAYALVRLDAVIPPTSPPTFDAARPELEALERTARERELMDQLARTMLRQGGSRPIDPGLRWSAEARRQ